MRAWLPVVLRGRRVLEVAAGTGYWTDVYADEATLVVATDVNQATLDVARKRRGWPSAVSFEVADANALQEVGGTFDSAFVGFFWSHVALTDLSLILLGIEDRLEPGGSCVFMDNRYVDGSNHPVTRTDIQGNTYQSRTLSDGSEWEVRKNFPTAGEVYSKLSAVASRVEVHEWTYFWAATCTFD